MKSKFSEDIERFLQKDFSDLKPGLGRTVRLNTTQGLCAVRVYRFGNWSSSGNSLVKKIARKIYFPLNLLIEITTGIIIGPQAEIGGGLYIPHPGGIVIHPKTKIGKNCTISQGVTLGVKAPFETERAPAIGDNVYIGAGAKVLGGIRIGNNVVIGANAVVVKDMPDNVVVGGIPAKIIRNL